MELARQARATVDNPISNGSKGQPVPHPALKIARLAEQDAQKYAEALLLTPAKRRQHGVQAADSEDELAELLRG